MYGCRYVHDCDILSCESVHFGLHKKDSLVQSRMTSTEAADLQINCTLESKSGFVFSVVDEHGAHHEFEVAPVFNEQTSSWAVFRPMTEWGATAGGGLYLVFTKGGTKWYFEGFPSLYPFMEMPAPAKSSEEITQRFFDLATGRKFITAKR